MNKTKLNVRDFITIGVISAVAIVLFISVGTIMAITPVGWLFMYSVLAIPLGILYMLLYTKVPKKGVVLVSSLIFALPMLMNNWMVPAIITIVAIINELIWSKGNREKFSNKVLAFTVFMTSRVVASFSTLYLLQDMYLTQFADRAEYFEAVLEALAGPLIIVSFAAVVLTSIIGAFLGKATLKKHFEKAGIV